MSTPIALDVLLTVCCCTAVPIALASASCVLNAPYTHTQGPLFIALRYVSCCVTWSLNLMSFLQEWTGMYWAKSSLKNLGLWIQLNHPSDQQCLKPAKATKDNFVIIDVSSIHCVRLDFCDCHCMLPHTVQLLCAGFYPASTKNPRTAAMFQVLDHFHMLLFILKISRFEFYATLLRLVDNTGTSPPPVSISLLDSITLALTCVDTVPLCGFHENDQGVAAPDTPQVLRSWT
jgi:hypothetical protein